MGKEVRISDLIQVLLEKMEDHGDAILGCQGKRRQKALPVEHITAWLEEGRLVISLEPDIIRAVTVELSESLADEIDRQILDDLTDLAEKEPEKVMLPENLNDKKLLDRWSRFILPKKEEEE